MKDIRLVKTSGPVTEDRINRLEAQLEKFAQSLNEFNKSGQAWNETKQKANYAAKPWDLILADATGGAFTISLPDPAKCIGAWIIVKAASGSANNVTVRAPFRGSVDTLPSFTVNNLDVKWLRASSDTWWTL